MIDHPHADDLDAEDGGGERGAEQRAEHAAHARQHHEVLACLVEPQLFAQPAAHAAPDLKGRALAACTAAQQMGDKGGHNNERGQAQRGALALAGALDHGVGAPVGAHAADLVYKNDHKPAHRQQV